MKLRRARRVLRQVAPHILDVGCGNHSPVVTKRWFPGCYYAGADIQHYNNSPDDLAAMDVFYPVGEDGSGYDAIPDNSFDFVILNHVIEHMRQPLETLEKLCAKLRPGGYIWIAFPSIKSLGLPSSEDETLQFCDDPTHIYVPDVREIANLLLVHGVRIVHAGPSRESLGTTAKDSIRLARKLLRKFLTGRFSGKGMWYILGFEDHVFGQRREHE